MYDTVTPGDPSGSRAECPACGRYCQLTDSGMFPTHSSRDAWRVSGRNDLCDVSGLGLLAAGFLDQPGDEDMRLSNAEPSALGWCTEYSTAKGAARVVLLAIAEAAGENRSVRLNTTSLLELTDLEVTPLMARIRELRDRGELGEVKEDGLWAWAFPAYETWLEAVGHDDEVLTQLSRSSARTEVIEVADQLTRRDRLVVWLATGVLRLTRKR